MSDCYLMKIAQYHSLLYCEPKTLLTVKFHNVMNGMMIVHNCKLHDSYSIYKQKKRKTNDQVMIKVEKAMERGRTITEGKMKTTATTTTTTKQNKTKQKQNKTKKQTNKTKKSRNQNPCI